MPRHDGNVVNSPKKTKQPLFKTPPKMSSQTGSVTPLTKTDDLRNTSQKSISTTIKKRREGNRRKFINLPRLKLDELQKQIQEADNEGTYEFPKELTEAEENKEHKPDVEPLQDSFDLNFTTLSLNTPAKKPEVPKTENFRTPSIENKPAAPKHDQSDFEYVTPNNKIPTKVQWSVKMHPYKQTPLTKLYAPPPAPLTKIDTVPPAPLAKLDTAPPAALTKLDTAPPAPVMKIDAAPPAPLTKMDTAPPAPLTNMVTAPPAPLTNLDTAPPAPVTNLDPAPPAPLPNLDTAPKFDIDSLSLPRVREEDEEVEEADTEPGGLLRSWDWAKIAINDVRYVVCNPLGKGGSSEVFHCFNPETRIHAAIKLVSLEDPSTAGGYINEVELLKSLQKCNRIIKMYDYEIREEKQALLVALEVGGTDLSKILKESSTCNAHLPLYTLLYYWMEMLYAVKQIHSNGVIHSDLKPANFLKVEGYLKLIDFGIARCVQNDMTSVVKSIPEGSFNYISPEALLNDNSSNTNSPSQSKPQYKVNYKSDVWSLGCILYQMVYRRTPFHHLAQPYMKLAAVVDPNHKIEYPAADWVPQKIINTIKSCLQVDLKQRPSVDDLILDYESMFRSLS